MDALIPRDEESEALIDRVVLINEFSKVRGGAAALVLLLAEKLVEMNIAVTLIAGDEGQVPDRLARAIEIVALNEKPLLDLPSWEAATKGIYNLSAEKLIAGWIARHDTDNTVYHLHNWVHIFSPSIFRALQSVWQRTVMHAHDYFLACPNGAYAHYPRGTSCLLAPLSKSCVSTNCDRRSYAQKLWRAGRHRTRQALWDLNANRTEILMIHDQMREPFERAGIPSSQLLTVRNPSEPYTSVRVEAEANQQYVFVGRVEEEKGTADFLSAARKAGVAARVVGDGSALSELRREFTEATFDGWQSRDQIAELIRSARMVVVPSRYPEPFGLVIVEALASGVPVILPTNALLAPEVTRLGVGIACNTRSLEELASIIAATAPDDVLVGSMSRRAFALRDTLSVDVDTWTAQIVSRYRARTGRAGS